MSPIRRRLSLAATAVVGIAVFLVPTSPATAAPQTFQLNPGQRECVTTRLTAYPDDLQYTQVDHLGSASAAVKWTRHGDIVDGNDGFDNASLAEQSVLDRTEQIFSEQLGETDDGPVTQKDVWFCAKNRGSAVVSATLEIRTSFRAAPTWILTRTGNSSYWAHGSLQPGERACTGGGGRGANIEAVIGLRNAIVSLSNSVMTRNVPTNQYASFSISSSQPGGFPEGLFGCVQNVDTVKLNFQFWFSYS